MSARPQPELARTAYLVLRKTRIAVFVDGCYWHGCPNHHTQPATNSQYWADKIARNIERDSETNEYLQRAGWTVLRAGSTRIPRPWPTESSKPCSRPSQVGVVIEGYGLVKLKNPVVPNPPRDHHLARSRAYSRAVTRAAQKLLVRDAGNGSARSPSCLIGNATGDFPCHTLYVLSFHPVRRHHNYMEGSCDHLGTTSK